ncbi:2OG-Fe dioxygenase family protein [Niveibacterium sp. SC-1]|uniref:2OG-Fe dioxygenase family protein n=1 Tax=Niveibacterium sp. SC-1 TaxID=3135646 RepID=UPI00312009F7
MSLLLSPPVTEPGHICNALRERGYAVLGADGLSELLDVERASLQALAPYWDDLVADAYLRDGGRYRFRRHACFELELASGSLRQSPPRAHWQPLEYNALHGGIERWFEPLAPDMVGSPAWAPLLGALGTRFAQRKPVPRWYIEAHAFRIDTREGIGRPTPEGAHRDGVDFVAVILVERHAVKGGETRVFEAEGPDGQRFTLHEPWSALLLDDQRVVHETTPIQPLAADGRRDTLVLTFRADGFQGPGQS